LKMTEKIYNKIIKEKNGDLTIVIDFCGGENLLEMIDTLSNAKTQMQNAGCPSDELKLGYYDYDQCALCVTWSKSYLITKGIKND